MQAAKKAVQPWLFPVKTKHGFDKRPLVYCPSCMKKTKPEATRCSKCGLALEKLDGL